MWHNYNFILLYLIVHLSYTIDGINTIVGWEAHISGGNTTGYVIIYTYCDGEDKYALNKTTTQYTIIGLDYSVINNITIVASNIMANSSASISTNIIGEEK